MVKPLGTAAPLNAPLPIDVIPSGILNPGGRVSLAKALSLMPPVRGLIDPDASIIKV